MFPLMPCQRIFTAAWIPTAFASPRPFKRLLKLIDIGSGGLDLPGRQCAPGGSIHGILASLLQPFLLRKLRRTSARGNSSSYQQLGAHSRAQNGLDRAKRVENKPRQRLRRPSAGSKCSTPPYPTSSLSWWPPGSSTS